MLFAASEKGSCRIDLGIIIFFCIVALIALVLIKAGALSLMESISKLP